MTVPVIDLFAGAGGIGIGAAQAGGDVRLSLEWDHDACETLRANDKKHCGQVIEADVNDYSGKDLRKLAGLGPKDPLLIVGGPPCQAFSKAAYWTDPGDDAAYRRARAEGITGIERPAPITHAKKDVRRDLSGDYIRKIIEADADGFLFENVRSILHPRNIKLAEKLIKTANDAGYKTRMIVANATWYGVPQMRERVVILGSRKHLPEEPVRTHKTKDNDAGPGLPPPAAGLALKPFASQRYHEPEEIVSGRWAQALKEIPPGMNYKALTAWAGHSKPLFVAETKFWSFLLKLSPDLPSWTVAASPGPWVGPFHWESRRLRTVELAALQTFPKDYIFSGNRRERVRQIGNAAPCLMIQRMTEALISATYGANAKKGAA